MNDETIDAAPTPDAPPPAQPAVGGQQRAAAADRERANAATGLRPSTERNANDYIEARDWRALPEQHRVLKEDGTLDAEATLWSLERGRRSYELRMGGGAQLRPLTPAEYTLEVPEDLQSLVDTLPAEGVEQFKREAHELGLSQAQYTALVAKHLKASVDLVRGAARIDAKSAISELRGEWPVPVDFDRNIERANAAVRAFAGDEASQVFQRFGNDAGFVRMMAKIGAEIGEDRAPQPGVTITGGHATIGEIVRSEAYTNAKHPDHARVSMQVREFFQRAEDRSPTLRRP